MGNGHSSPVKRSVVRRLRAVPVDSAPPIHRGSMPARPWRGFVASLRAAASAVWQGRPQSSQARPMRAERAWERAARERRRVLLASVAVSTGLATDLFSQVLPASSDGAMHALQVTLFAVLFAWVSAGFFTALMGFVVLLRGDRHAMSASSLEGARAVGPIDPRARTAIIMPICNEDVRTVFAGLRATWESVRAGGTPEIFDLFVLSDTSDPAIRDAEVAAWRTLRDEMGTGARIHYRWRQRRTKRKAGNVADFCRRWGRDYRYMVVLDADSVMTGDVLTKLVRLMEANPRAGILQTAPQTCGLSTVHARAQQFAGRVVGRLFTAGMQYWQLGESHYWGHNAIIRVAPFMDHCALAPIAGTGGLSGEILSHDFVEAALMRRAGYHVWLVHDLQGSYEQQPPNLIEELRRDRRWCQGNLQNVRLIAEPGLHGVHRAMLFTGAFAYLSAPLWLAFVLIGPGLRTLAELPAGRIHDLAALAALWGMTLAMLILPRLLGAAAIILRGEQHLYGGSSALLQSTLIEMGISMVQAPVRMIAHSVFVFVALTGLRLTWKSPPREANDVGWGEAANHFGWIGGVAAAVTGTILAFFPNTMLWLVPTSVPLMIAVPLVVMTSRSRLGQQLRARRLLVTPEEHSVPAVLNLAWEHAARMRA